MKKATARQIFAIITLTLLITITFCLANPAIIIKVHKLLYVKYVRIIKGDFAKRFNDKELNLAIQHAANEPWVQQQVAADLAPFKGGITSEQIDRWFKDLQHDSQNKLVKFKIVSGKIQVDVSEEIYESRAYKTVYSVIEMLSQKKHIPDCEFIIALNDYLAYIPKDLTAPAAILSFAKHTQIPIEQNTILVPDWMNIRYWDLLNNRVTLANRLFPWQRKKNLIHWRGGSADSMQHRSQLITLRDKFKFLDVGITEGANPAIHVDPEFSIQYKYQIALDGARCTWERVVWQLHSNTALIKPISPQMQWFHRGLIPYHNYIPIADVTEENIGLAYYWLQNNDQFVKSIVQNANTFARENLKTQDFFAYYAVLLQEYSKLMRA